MNEPPDPSPASPRKMPSVRQHALLGALIVGGVSFAVSFIGPVVFMPDLSMPDVLKGADQSVKLGILLTGPVGLALGLIGGAVAGMIRRQWQPDGHVLMAGKITRVLSSLSLILAGCWIVHQMNLSARDRVIPELLQWKLFWMAPTTAVLGLLLLLRTPAWGRRWCSRRNVLVLGALGLVAGVGLVALLRGTDRGGDASWAHSMWAMMSAVFVGMPALGLILVSFALRSDSDTP